MLSVRELPLLAPFRSKPPYARALFVGLFVATFGVGAPRRAQADGVATDAGADYDAGADAYDRKDYATAATRFAQADEKVPNSRALQLAMASALLGTDAALGMNLAERAETRAVDGSLVELGRRLRRKFEGSSARVRFVCPPAASCSARIDGVDVDTGSVRWVTPGRHVFSARAAGDPLERSAILAAGASMEIVVPASRTGSVGSERPVASSFAPGPRREQTRGVSPVFFWSSAALTAVAVGASVALTVDAEHKHDAFVANPSADTSAAGDSAQMRQRIALGAAGVFAVTTAVLAFLTDFRATSTDAPKQASRQANVDLGFGPRGVVLSGGFR